MLFSEHQIPPSSADANIVTDIEEKCNRFFEKNLEISAKISIILNYLALFGFNRAFLRKKSGNLSFPPEIFQILKKSSKRYFYSSVRNIRTKREREKIKRESEETVRRRR